MQSQKNHQISQDIEVQKLYVIERFLGTKSGKGNCLIGVTDIIYWMDHQSILRS